MPLVGQSSVDIIAPMCHETRYQNDLKSSSLWLLSILLHYHYYNK